MARQEICEFLKVQNRPYSITDLTSHFNKQHSKSDVQKALDELVDDGKIMEKVNAKQKIYCYIQESKQDPKELMRTDKELQAHANELEQKLHSLQKQIKQKETVLADLKNRPTVEQILEQKETLNKNIKKLNYKLDELMATSSIQQDLPIKKRKLEKDLDVYQKEYNKRKRQCVEIIDCILENYTQSKQDLYDEIGIDVVNV